VCGSAARTDLYGGQLAIAVPTVTGISPNERRVHTSITECSHVTSVPLKLLDRPAHSVPLVLSISGVLKFLSLQNCLIYIYGISRST
jgi:hypothetical protein